MSKSTFSYTANKTYNELGDSGFITIEQVKDGTYTISWNETFGRREVSGLASYEEAIGYAKCLTGNGKLKKIR